MPTTNISDELKTYQRERSALLTDRSNIGQFMLIHSDRLIGLYPTFDAALAVGYEKFELQQFLVKELTDTEEPKYFSRNLRCQS